MTRRGCERGGGHSGRDRARARGRGPAAVLGAAGRVLREMLLTLAAIGGAACIVLVILAYVGGYTLIMFKTGSMSPTIPAGSVALVREVPASEIEVGDVLTIDRQGQLPVTHRVTSVGPGPGDTRTITMRGDANEENDPAPYIVDRGRAVVGSVPHLAHVIVWFGNPWVLGGITLAAASLVTWAFWPRGPERSTAAEPTGASRPARASACRVPTTVLVGALGLAGLLAGSPATEAQAADALVLRSDLPDGVHLLDASEPLLWHVEVDAGAAPDGGDLRVAIAGSGSARTGVAAEIRACDLPWSGDGCAAGERLLRAASVLPVGGGWGELLRIGTPAVTHLRLSVTAHPVEDAEAGERTRLTVRAVAAEWQDETSIDGGSSGEERLAGTGAPAFALLAAPAAVLLGLIGALLARRRPAGPRQHGSGSVLL